jgi:hypothetical protein
MSRLISGATGLRSISMSATNSGAPEASSTGEAFNSKERVLLHVYELGTGTRLAEAIRGLNAVTKSGLGAGVTRAAPTCVPTKP